MTQTRSTASPAKRKGAMRMADIPKAVLAQLNRGRIESLTLAEFLAIDQGRLLLIVCEEVKLELPRGERPTLDGLGVMDRLKTIGAALAAALRRHRRRRAVEKLLATHTSDMVRNWAAWAIVACDPDLSIEARIERALPFAADPNMGVREIAWMSIRDTVASDPHKCIQTLLPLTKHGDANVRRFASEATRPRGVWCRHIDRLKADPAIALPLLEALRSDASLYVRRSVGNWLNDASKSDATWVTSVTRRWLKESPTRETRWIVNHATRTMRKKG